MLPVSDGKVGVFDNHNSTTIRLSSVSINFSLIDEALLHFHPLLENSRRVVVNVISRDFRWND